MTPDNVLADLDAQGAKANPRPWLDYAMTLASDGTPVAKFRADNWPLGKANITYATVAVNHLRRQVAAHLGRVDKCYCDQPKGCPHDVSAQALAALWRDLAALGVVQ